MISGDLLRLGVKVGGKMGVNALVGVLGVGSYAYRRFGLEVAEFMSALSMPHRMDHI